MFKAEKKPKDFVKKAFLFAFFALACITSIFILFIGGVQQKYLAEGNFNKTISSVRVVTYAGEPFRSLVCEERIIVERATLDELQKRMNEQNVSLKKQQPTSTVMFITYFGGSSMIAYVNGEVLGVDYGRITLRVRGLSELLQ